MAVYYPPVGFHFEVTFGIGETESDARFQEVGGLSTEIGTEELQEGGENRFSHKLPGRTKFGNLILKRGMLVDSKLIDWFKNAIENLSFEPADVEVTLLNEEHDPVMSWSFTKAYPVKWSVSDLKAQDNAIVVETIELAYNYFRRS
jgi:phage tail-like protein